MLTRAHDLSSKEGSPFVEPEPAINVPACMRTRGEKVTPVLVSDDDDHFTKLTGTYSCDHQLATMDWNEYFRVKSGGWC
jgi:hypothetical protein